MTTLIELVRQVDQSEREVRAGAAERVEITVVVDRYGMGFTANRDLPPMPQEELIDHYRIDDPRFDA